MGLSVRAILKSTENINLPLMPFSGLAEASLPAPATTHCETEGNPGALLCSARTEKATGENTKREYWAASVTAHARQRQLAGRTAAGKVVPALLQFHCTEPPESVPTRTKLLLPSGAAAVPYSTVISPH